MKKKITGIWLLVLLAVFTQPLAAAEVEGKVQWAAPLTLSTNLDAEVVQTTAAPGQRVKKGALLVQLEGGVLRARLTQVRAELVHQKLLLAEAKNELQRSEELYERTLLSDHDLDLARIAHAGADSSYQHALAELKSAQRAVELTRIVAPFDVLVLERHVQAGETVNGQFRSVPLYTLVVTDKRLVRLDVEASQAQRVSVGDELELQIAKRRYSGRVEAINLYREKPSSARVMIDILFTPGKDAPVMIGETVRLKLP